MASTMIQIAFASPDSSLRNRGFNVAHHFLRRLIATASDNGSALSRDPRFLELPLNMLRRDASYKLVLTKYQTYPLRPCLTISDLGCSNRSRPRILAVSNLQSAL